MPPSTSLTDDILARLRAHQTELRAAGIARLSVFGSVARGEATPDSDVDLAAEIHPEAALDLITLSALERHIAELLGRNVDLHPEPVNKQRLQANIDRDRRRAF